MFKLDLEKAEEPEIKLPTSIGSSKKQASSRKTSISALLTTPKPLTVWITINCGKFWKRWECQNTWPDSWEICMQGRKQQLELDTEQQTSSKLGKEYVKAVYCHPAYLTYMQSTSWETLGWRKHKLESRLPGEISIISDMRWHYPYGRKWKGTKKASWLKWKRRVKKLVQHSENKDRGIWSHHFMENRWGKQWKQWLTLFFWALKSLWMVIAAIKLKDTCSLEEKLWPT